MDAEFLRREALALHLDLSPSQLEEFVRFEDDLYRANEVMNLTRVPRPECVIRHFLDSLLISPWIGPDSRVLDIGTGPGFPAWPLACARPDLMVTALDSSGKMLGFLRQHDLPNLAVMQGRMEEAGWREQFDIITGRAVAPLAIQLELSAAAATLGGYVLPLRSAPDRRLAEELADLPGLGLHLETIHTVCLADTGIERIFPLYRKVAKTDPKYPRAWAEIKRKPLGA